MAGTRKQIESKTGSRKRRSLLRDSERQIAATSADKRPAGPSSHSDPGMGSPTSPLPPGVPISRQAAFLTHPQIAGSFRNETDAPVGIVEAPAESDDSTDEH
jgi:hypothetical protein